MSELVNEDKAIKQQMRKVNSANARNTLDGFPFPVDRLPFTC
jgi:hypothetical protein